jgi:uncharacterized protein (DUF433 family)
METIADHIVITPGTCSGRPRVAGTRIRVANIALWTEAGMSADEIVASYPHLTLADVYAALAYYHDHREEIESQMREDEEFVERLMAETGAGPLAEKLGADGKESDSLSS